MDKMEQLNIFQAHNMNPHTAFNTGHSRVRLQN